MSDAFPSRPDLDSHPDRVSWNGRHAGARPAAELRPLIRRALDLGVPAGPVLELACGVSGSALALALAGFRVTAMDISDYALRQLQGAADRLGVAGLLRPVQADLAGQELPREAFALVCATFFWDPVVFARAHRAVAPGGVLAWEAVTSAGDGSRPGSKPWLARPDEPALLLPPSFRVVESTVWDPPPVPGRPDGADRHSTVRLLARRADRLRS